MSANSNPLKEPTAGKMPRRDLIKTPAAAGATACVLAGADAASAQGATSAQDGAEGGRMKIGINLEYVRHGDKSLAYATMKVNLLAIAETCAENGVYLGVEQHGPYTARVKSLTRVLELVDSPWIRVNYDCGNTFLSGEDPYAMLEAVIDKVIHVHAKDISRKQAAAERGKVTGTAVGCACGDGEIDWHRIVKRLKQAGFKGVLSVECGTAEDAKRSLPYLTNVLRAENA